MKKTFSILLTCIIFSQCVYASHKLVADHTLFNGDKLSEFQMENGMRVLHVPRHQAQVVTFQLWFDVGSIDEKLDVKLQKTGLAHLFEHMMFRGTEKFPDGKFDEASSKMGAAEQNATTYYYRTNYFESVPSTQLEAIMYLEADRMKNLKLDADLLNKEKGAVVGELRRILDNPGRAAFDELMRLSFQKAPYRWSVIGSEEEIKGFTLEEAQYFYKTYYAPNNATMIVVGDVEADRLMDLADKYFGNMKAQEIPKGIIPEEPAQKKERRYSRSHPQATSETMIVAYRIPPITSSEIVPLALLGTHLSTGMEARLRKLLVDTGIAVSASGNPGSQPDLFKFWVSMADKHHSQEALKIIDAEIALLQKQPISDRDFQRALNQELLDLYGGIGKNSSMANFLGEYLMMSGNYMRGFEIINQFKTISPKDLQKVAQKYLVPKSRNIVVITPPAKKGANS